MENFTDKFELDEMKQQIQLLKDKLAKEIIVSEKLLKNSTQDKIAYINRKKRFIYFLIVFCFSLLQYIFLADGIFVGFLCIYFCVFDYSWNLPAI